MAGNPVFAGVSGFCVNGYPRNTWSNIYANTQVSWFQVVTQVPGLCGVAVLFSLEATSLSNMGGLFEPI